MIECTAAPSKQIFPSKKGSTINTKNYIEKEIMGLLDGINAT